MTSSFGLNEWTFIGLSVYKTGRVTDSQEIHFVTKTKSGTENQDSFNDQDFTFNCNYPQVNLQILMFQTPNGVIKATLGAENETIFTDFTGYINLMMLYLSPMTPIEMIDNSFKYPNENLEYDYHLAIAMVITDDNSTEFSNKFLDYVNMYEYEYNFTAPQPQAVDMVGDPISV
jgi:hypothetical protein